MEVQLTFSHSSSAQATPTIMHHPQKHHCHHHRHHHHCHPNHQRHPHQHHHRHYLFTHASLATSQHPYEGWEQYATIRLLSYDPPPHTAPHPSILVTTVFGGRSIHKKDKHKSTLLFLVTGMPPLTPPLFWPGIYMYFRSTLCRTFLIPEQSNNFLYILATSSRHLAKPMTGTPSITLATNKFCSNLKRESVEKSLRQVKTVYKVNIYNDVKRESVKYMRVLLKYKENLW